MSCNFYKLVKYYKKNINVLYNKSYNMTILNK